MDSIIEGIEGSPKFKSIALINKGYSGEKKYYIETFAGEKYLMRLTDLSQYNRKKIEYETLKNVSGINLNKPLHIGAYDKKNMTFTVYSWVEGKDLNDVLPAVSEEEQYQLGIQSGKLIKQLHQVQLPVKVKQWDERFNDKLDNKIKNYEACEIKISGMEGIIGFINKNRDLLKSRPQTFQHGDYHVGNMIINDHNEIGIVDFSRYDFGDPWDEFSRIAWCVQISPAFACGQLDGYFDNNIPEEFWRLLAIYIGSNQLSYIPWAAKFGETELQSAIKQTQDVLNWYGGSNEYIPHWYTSKYIDNAKIL